MAGLVQGLDGNFYGTTNTAGANDGGTVFKISATGTLTTLFSFGTGAMAFEGSLPNAALIQAQDGNFYGTTSREGSPGGGIARGAGTVFKITPDGALTTLHTFVGGDGSEPTAALALASDGNFYGTTIQGGAGGQGTIFKITPAGALTSIHSFRNDASDGAQPAAVLVEGTDGKLYGTTAAGGFDSTPGGGGGTAFSITLTGGLTTLHIFPFGGSPEPWGPVAGLVLGSDGNFYGTTGGGSQGAGTVYRMSSGGAITLLYSFLFGSMDGAAPSSGLIQGSDGNLYGTTQQGGSGNAGTIYRIAPNGKIQTLHAFNIVDGEVPNGVVEGTDGSFYGTTAGGGPTGDGTVFRLTIAPDSPTGVTATSGIREVTLSWTAARRTVDYNVYQSTTPGGQSTMPVKFGIAATTTTITGLAESTTYFFTVAGVNEAGPGLISSEVSANTSAPPQAGGGGGVLGLLSLAALMTAVHLRRRQRATRLTRSE